MQDRRPRGQWPNTEAAHTLTRYCPSMSGMWCLLVNETMTSARNYSPSRKCSPRKEYSSLEWWHTDYMVSLPWYEGVRYALSSWNCEWTDTSMYPVQKTNQDYTIKTLTRLMASYGTVQAIKNYLGHSCTIHRCNCAKVGWRQQHWTVVSPAV